MNNKLTSRDVLQIASIIKIGVTDDEAAMFADDINSILEFAEILQTADISCVEPMFNPLQTGLPLRDDVVEPGLSRDDVLKAAAHKEHGHFKVPKTIDG